MSKFTIGDSETHVIEEGIDNSEDYAITCVDVNAEIGELMVEDGGMLDISLVINSNVGLRQVTFKLEVDDELMDWILESKKK